jgi:hypothetical protein
MKVGGGLKNSVSPTRNLMCSVYLLDVMHVYELKETIPGPSVSNGDKNFIFAVLYSSKTCVPDLQARIEQEVTGEMGHIK